jgi:hypothetical protein
MANYYSGVLKLRGMSKNISRFLLRTFKCKNREVEETEGSMIIRNCSENENRFYGNGTERNFVDCKEITWNFRESVFIIRNYTGAWGVDCDTLTEISKKYEVDLKIYALEEQEKYSIDFEVHAGNVIKCELVEYTCSQDSIWEMPLL